MQGREGLDWPLQPAVGGPLSRDRAAHDHALHDHAGRDATTMRRMPDRRRRTTRPR